MPLPIASAVLWPLTFQGVKCAVLMKNSPTIDTNARAANFRIVVMTWIAPMFCTPERLIAAGIHSPISTSTMEKSVLWPLLMKCST